MDKLMLRIKEIEHSINYLKGFETNEHMKNRRKTLQKELKALRKRGSFEVVDGLKPFWGLSEIKKGEWVYIIHSKV